MNIAQKPRIASISEPSLGRMASALVLLVYLAREALSVAERSADVDDLDTALERESAVGQALEQVVQAEALLRSAQALHVPWTTAGIVRSGIHVRRAIHATEALAGHVKLAGEYTRFRVRGKLDDAEEKERKRQHTIWRNSARQARSEAHRALAELTEEFPDAYEVDDA
jgi:hypothetical protein